MAGNSNSGRRSKDAKAAKPLTFINMPAFVWDAADTGKVSSRTAICRKLKASYIKAGGVVQVHTAHLIELWADAEYELQLARRAILKSPEEPKLGPLCAYAHRAKMAGEIKSIMRLLGLAHYAKAKPVETAQTAKEKQQARFRPQIVK